VFFRPPTGQPPNTPEPEPDAPDLDPMAQDRATLANGFLMMREQLLAPAFDAADGMRADLLARGYSPGAAEVLTVTWLQRTIANLTPLAGGLR
jgi:hypothetical protein